MVSVALLSNPRSTGNRSQLPKVRSFCLHHPDIFHYEVDEVGQIGDALASIARVKPKILVINGGDGTVQAALTELYNGSHFDGPAPPVAVLPNGKTNLIAIDLGSDGDPIEALERILELSHADLSPHIVQRELIALTSGGNSLPTVGMFLGGAGLADTILFCRHKIYPLGLPNALSHFIAAILVILSMIIRIPNRFLPPAPSPVTVSVSQGGDVNGRFSLLIITTLEKLLLSSRTQDSDSGQMKLMAVDGSLWAVFRAVTASISGSLGKSHLSGVYLRQGHEMAIEGDRSSVILDGELFTANRGFPITLRATQPIPFLRLAA